MGLTAPVSQSAEEVDLKSIQCQFESDQGHMDIKAIKLALIDKRKKEYYAAKKARLKNPS